MQFPDLPDGNQTTPSLAVTTFSYGLSGIRAFAVVGFYGEDGHAYRTIHSLGRHITACIAASGKLVSSTIHVGADW